MKEDEREARIAESIRINQEIKERPYKKYGGLENLLIYMRDHTPSYPIDKSIKANSAYESFEIRYSQAQKDELVASLKKKDNEIMQQFIKMQQLKKNYV